MDIKLISFYTIYYILATDDSILCNCAYNIVHTWPQCAIFAYKKQIIRVIYLLQSFIFHVETPPNYPNFTQCVTFGFFKSSVDENVYNIFCVLAMYFIPLVIIFWVYTKILCEITSKSRESKQGLQFFFIHYYYQLLRYSNNIFIIST